MTNTGHDLTLVPDPVTGWARPVGRCSCGKFRVTGREAVIRDFHAIHVQYPETSFKAEAS
jgi:hypothetical protein